MTVLKIGNGNGERSALVILRDLELGVKYDKELYGDTEDRQSTGINSFIPCR